MNAISVSHHRNAGISIYDVDGCIRLWGRRGILSGGIAGLLLGAIFVTNLFPANVLTFGIIGTLIVCGIECAAIGGGIAALLAALNGRGVLRGYTAGFEGTRVTMRPPDSARR